MTREEWLAVEGAFTAIIHDARTGLCDASKAETQHPVMAAVFVLLAAARGLPYIALHTGQEHLLPALQRLRDTVGDAVLHELFPEDDDVPPAFRRAFGEEEDDGG